MIEGHCKAKEQQIVTLQPPPRLTPGMTLGVIAPSSQTLEWSRVKRGLARLEELGFRHVLAPHARQTYGYLAGQDRDRAADLVEMLERQDMDGVICTSGGYGALRTALAVDRERLRACADRPKPFIGFSDITVLHALLQRELGWITFYGPVVTTLGRATAYTLDALRRALLDTAPFDVAADPDDGYLETIVGGAASGRLAGGCLSLVVSLLGTPWEIDLRDAIFVFEDIHEQPYTIDRMLSQLLAAGRLQRCAGIIIGEHVDCDPRQPGNTLGLEQVFDDLIRPLGIPTLYRLPVGHGKHMATLPLGARAELDATNQTLRIVEPGIAGDDPHVGDSSQHDAD
jgi:muramoyltetrapeptide carboxypeptidase